MLVVVTFRVTRSPVTAEAGPLMVVVRSKADTTVMAADAWLLGVRPASLVVVAIVAVATTGPTAGASKVITEVVGVPLAMEVSPVYDTTPVVLL